MVGLDSDAVALHLDVYDTLSGPGRDPVSEEALHRQVEEVLSDESDVVPAWLTPGVLTACRYAGWTIAALVVQAAEEILPDGRRLAMRRRTEEALSETAEDTKGPDRSEQDSGPFRGHPPHDRI